MSTQTSTSAETMRRAAVLMRRERGDDPFYRAVSVLLDEFANQIDAGRYWRDVAALEVARSYLGC